MSESFIIRINCFITYLVFEITCIMQLGDGFSPGAFVLRGLIWFFASYGYTRVLKRNKYYNFLKYFDFWYMLFGVALMSVTSVLSIYTKELKFIANLGQLMFFIKWLLIGLTSKKKSIRIDKR